MRSFLDKCVFNGDDQRLRRREDGGCDLRQLHDWRCHRGEHASSRQTPAVAAMISHGACMTAFANGSASTTPCALALGQIEQCSFKSCVTACVNASDETFTTCLQDAIGT